MVNEDGKKPVLALYASPECCRKPNLLLYKSYFNVAWFVRAYSSLLFCKYEVITTDETKAAIMGVEDQVDEGLHDVWDLSNDDFLEEWRVPVPLQENLLHSLGAGFDAQVKLAAMVAKGKVDRLLIFQDPDDVQMHLPEAYALVRNCTLANVPLYINAGSTFWAEAEWQREKRLVTDAEPFGKWRRERTSQFHALLNPPKQRIAFIAHNSEKPRMSRLIYHYRNQLNSSGFQLTGTSGTLQHARQYLADKDTPPWEEPKLRAAGAAGVGHGPTGGDVVIADEIVQQWPCDEERKKAADLDEKEAHKAKPPVRLNKLSHTVIFFIDHRHAQPHQADIHVLLRTCIHPSHGIHLLLNERSAREWAETLRSRILSPKRDGGAE